MQPTTPNTPTTPPPAERLLRLSQIIGDKKRGIAPLVPVSPATWWQGCRTGRFPKGRKLGPATTVWRLSEITALIESAK